MIVAPCRGNSLYLPIPFEQRLSDHARIYPIASALDAYCLLTG